MAIRTVAEIMGHVEREKFYLPDKSGELYAMCNQDDLSLRELMELQLYLDAFEYARRALVVDADGVDIERAKAAARSAARKAGISVNADGHISVIDAMRASKKILVLIFYDPIPEDVQDRVPQNAIAALHLFFWTREEPSATQTTASIEM